MFGFGIAEFAFIFVVLIVVLVSVWVIFIEPRYNVYAQRMKGEADLAQAQAETRIAVCKATAELEAATHLAEADVARAKGIALSIAEIEDKLGGAEGYLRWKFIHFLEQQGSVNQIVYIPTEATMPILEAGKGHKVDAKT